MRILHLSPTSGDVALACPATLRALSSAGHTVVDFCPHPKEGHERACRALGIKSGEGSPRKALLEEWEIIISPDVFSGDPEHEKVARAVRSRIENEYWWRWALWSHIQNPNMIYPFSGRELSLLQKNIHYFSDSWRGGLLRGRAEFVGATAGHDWPKKLHFSFAEAFHTLRKKEDRWIVANRHILDPTCLLQSGKATSRAEG